MADSNKLPIQRLTLYKHGVGFVERSGTVQQSEVQLVFRQTEVNDALKSLLVLDRQGGQVRGIHYETPGLNSGRENLINLTADHSLLDLLRSLRGRLVRLTIGEDTSQQEYSGQLLGVEVDAKEPLTKSQVALLLGQDKADSNQVVNLPLQQLRSVVLLEERSGQDLRFFLDSSRNDEAHRTVTLQLDNQDAQAAHELAVSYLIPCPTWRVSYRLIAELEAVEGEAEAAVTPTEPRSPATPQDLKGTLLLQGWGLFDNRLEEDLEDVQVRLVAGQPISFIYDLTSSRIPDRPIVQDTARIAAGPVEFEASLDAFGSAYPAPEPTGGQRFGVLSKRESAAAPMMAGRAATAAKPSMQKEQRAAVTTNATGSNLGELFQYIVTKPVTVKRGESALVPILNNTLPYRHELLYNAQKMPQHPVATMRFKNTTSLVLERGPITVIEDDEYRGEAMIPFTPAEGEVYLAYAVELGIKVSEEASYSNETTGIEIKNATLFFNQIYTTRTTYQIENNLSQPRVVTIEKPDNSGYQLAPTTPKPAEQTAEFYRWKISCPSKQRTVFVVEERMLNWYNEQVTQQDYARLNEYLRNNWLDAQTIAKLQEILLEQNTISQNSQEIQTIEVERGDLYLRQEQLRQNLTVLATSGEEAQLRRRVFEQLSNTEARLNAIDQRIDALKVDNKQRQSKLTQLIAKLG